jgi:hypothetical protein
MHLWPIWPTSPLSKPWPQRSPSTNSGEFTLMLQLRHSREPNCDGFVLQLKSCSVKPMDIKSPSDHYSVIHRTVHCVNRDPALEWIASEPHVDIREAVQTRDVMECFKFEPNGALLCFLELISSNSKKCFAEAIDDHKSDSLLINLPARSSFPHT